MTLPVSASYGPGPPSFCRAGFQSCRRRVEYSGGVPRYCGEALVIDCGDFVKKPNYHQAKRRKEESRKARQQKKLQRRLDRTTVPDERGVTEMSPTEPSQPTDPADEVSS
jgi:hypothetical protein